MVLAWVMRHKLVLVLSVALTAFAISTITLAVQKTDVETQLRSCFIENGLIVEECAAAASASTTSTTSTTTTTPPATLPTTLSPEPEVGYKLPSIVIPIQYELELIPNIEDGSFSGRNRINVNVTGATDTILLHSNGLTIESVTVDASETAVLITFELIPERELLKINLDRLVPAAQLSYDDDIYVTIAFSGSMLDRIVGLYSSSYLDEQLQPRHLNKIL